MLGLNLKEGLLLLFIVIGFFKRAPLTGEFWRIPAFNVSELLFFTETLDTSPSVEPVPGESQKQEDAQIVSKETRVEAKHGQDLAEAITSQCPIVLQNLTNKVAYNGHIGRIINSTGSRVLVAVHGVFSDAPSTNIWVKPHHIRLLQQSTLGSSMEQKQIAVSASSNRGDYPASVVLEHDDKKWWISKPGSFMLGSGLEYLEFDFGSVSVVRVLGISIPPMPYGPLSVREFSVEALMKDTWIPVTPRLRTLDRAGMQEVALELVETRRLRVNCFASAAPMDSVGLFQISFW